MPVNLTEPAALAPISGVRLATIGAAIRYRDRDDLTLVELAPGSRVAATFTRNAFCAAPVTLARQHLAESEVRYLLINAGNANAGTGEAGLQAARQCCALLAAEAGVDAQAVLPFSTGVIGELLPVEPFAAHLPALLKDLDGDAWTAAARAIMTTDTLAKGSSRRVATRAGTVTLTGIAKGSGMIHPRMATMLAFVATDADIPQALLDQLNREAVDQSFNRITVDGDTSTNDACVLMASGSSAVTLSEVSDDLQAFREALLSLYTELAQAIVRDGEGASRFVSIEVSQANTTAEASVVAKSIAHSPLVKTALFAADPNWGRILSAVGNAPVANLEIERVDLSINDVAIVKGGEIAADYSEEHGVAAMNSEEIKIQVALGRGPASETVWTCDLSHEYVTINAEYRS